MMNEPRKARRTFDEAFKRDAVGLLLQGDKRVKQLAQELGVSQWNLRDWRAQYGPPAPVKTTEQLEAELRVLRRENESLRTQRLVQAQDQKPHRPRKWRLPPAKVSRWRWSTAAG